VQGELLFAGSEELILRREDPRAGTPCTASTP
ncbi:hypothetical protein N1E56_18975, partial [Pseudomonas aeruginosa]|nr:hypothetical protein [Pseudomonas aeruginosa]